MGEKLLAGALLAKGIHIQRRRIRQSVSRVDPVGKALRRFRRLKKENLFSGRTKCFVVSASSVQILFEQKTGL